MCVPIGPVYAVGRADLTIGAPLQVEGVVTWKGQACDALGWAHGVHGVGITEGAGSGAAMVRR